MSSDFGGTDGGERKFWKFIHSSGSARTATLNSKRWWWSTRLGEKGSVDGRCGLFVRIELPFLCDSEY